MGYFSELGKQAARRSTAKSQSVKVFGKDGDKALHRALHTASEDARQLPWTYGEKRQRGTADNQQIV